jgi:hypothetical protein
MVAVTTTDYFITNDFFATVVRTDVDVTPVGLKPVSAQSPERNWIRNPDGFFAQNQTTSTTVADGAYGKIDLWWALTQTANITLDIGTVTDYSPGAFALTQPAAAAQRMGLGHLIRAEDTRYLIGQTVTFSSFFIKVGGSVTWRIAVLAWMAGGDNPTKDVVNDWTSTTYTEGNFFISSANYEVIATAEATGADGVITQVHCSGVVPSGADNIVVVGWTVGTQAQNDSVYVFRNTLKIGANDTPAIILTPDEELPMIQERKRLATRAYSEYLTHGSTNTAIPLDDTIPQISEGVEILAASVTKPGGSGYTNSSFTARVSIHINCSVAVNFDAVNVALFLNGASNAVAAWTEVPGAGITQPAAIDLVHEATMATNTHAYTARIGPATGGATSTMYLNGVSTGRYFGGVAKCTLVVEVLEDITTL